MNLKPNVNFHGCISLGNKRGIVSRFSATGQRLPIPGDIRKYRQEMMATSSRSRQHTNTPTTPQGQREWDRIFGHGNRSRKAKTA